MVATPIAPTNRYYRPGITKIYFCDTIADISSPTRAELDDGTDLSGEVEEVSGFMVVSATVDAPDFGSRFRAKISSDITADDSSLTFYADKTSADIRALLPRDTEGFMVFLDEGDVPTQLMDVFPVSIGSLAKLRTRDDPARHQVSCTITSEPAEDVAIPAAV